MAGLCRELSLEGEVCLASWSRCHLGHPPPFRRLGSSLGSSPIPASASTYSGKQPVTIQVVGSLPPILEKNTWKDTGYINTLFPGRNNGNLVELRFTANLFILLNILTTVYVF